MNNVANDFVKRHRMQELEANEIISIFKFTMYLNIWLGMYAIISYLFIWLSTLMY